MKKKIFRKILFDINNFFLIVLLSVALIIWVIQAVNFLDYVSEDGHGFYVYFSFTLLNFPRIIGSILPFILFISIFYTFVKYENNNELLIFWTNGITKEEFAKFIVKFSLLYLIFQMLLTSVIIPKSQNMARSFIRASTIDFFPSLIKEKEFIDTVENLTIFIEKKNEDGKMFNIFLKDKLTDDRSQIIYAKEGTININEDLTYMLLKNGKIINIEEEKMISLSFEQIQFDLSNYTTKTTTWPKIQEHSTFALLSCMVNTLSKKIILEENFYLRCTKDFYKEVVEEFLKRIYLPVFIPIISLIACFITLKSKENYGYSKFKLLLFIIGIVIILVSVLSLGLANLNQWAFLSFLLIPIIIYYLTFSIFKSKAKYI
jgi:lipopolysaccharide export system permease protein